MGKLIPLLFAGAGAAAVSVGGVYMLNNKSNSQEQKIFRSLSEFKGEHGGACTKRLFGTVNFPTTPASGTGTQPTQISSSNKVAKTDFDGAQGTEESCLRIQWEKSDVKETTGSESSGQKWLGYFTVLWNLKKGDKGFSMFLAAVPNAEEKKLSLEGGFYFLSKSGSPATWSVNKYKELTNQTLNKDDFDNKFPKAKDDVKGAVTATEESQKALWGFVSAKDDLEKAHKKLQEGASSPTIAQTKSWSASWTWTPDTAKTNNKMTDWSENLETWANQLFTSSEAEVKSIAEQFKGTWTQS